MPLPCGAVGLSVAVIVAVTSDTQMHSCLLLPYFKIQLHLYISSTYTVITMYFERVMSVRDWHIKKNRSIFVHIR